MLGLLVLSACSASKFKTYRGPAVTQILIDKSDRRMWLFHNQTVLKEYKVELGFAPVGHKQFEGDGRTPEGLYYIDRRNPNSRFHLSLGISYPNAADRAYARERGKSPGGDIFIHGGPDLRKWFGKKDWTWGCIAVKDREMETIYSMVGKGTAVYIRP
ncbi:MAG: L,D-transpeptidase family protein [Pseudomonadota bacterium]